MLRVLVRIGIFLLSSAVGLLVAKLLLNGMRIEVASFLIVVVLFAVLQALIAPGCAKLMKRGSDALLSVVGLASTVVALILTTLISPGLSISGIGTWIWASLIIWIVTVAATFFLPKLVAKTKLGAKAKLRTNADAKN